MKCIWKLMSVVVLVATAGCGRFGPPVPPRALAPSVPTAITCRFDGPAVVLAWANPTSDRRSKKLQSFDSIRVYRRTLPSVLDTDVTLSDWEILKDIPITNFVPGKDASAAPGPLAAVSVPGASEKVSVATTEIRDPSIAPGNTYQYAVVGTNQDGLLGDASDFYQVQVSGVGVGEILVIPNQKKKLNS